MAIDVGQIVSDMEKAATGVLKSDITTLRGFSDRQIRAIAQQAALVEAGILSGQITDETRDFFLDSIEDMTQNFVRTLRGLSSIMMEKLWNAMVGVIWKAISTATGIKLPAPTYD